MPPDALNFSDCALVLVDFNQGLLQMLPPSRREIVLQGAIALSKIGAVFDLPTIVLGKGAEENFGELVSAIDEIHAAAPHPVRHTLSAWRNAEFVQIVRACGRKTFILAGVSTDLCVSLLALDLLRNGYRVVLVADASGCQDPIAEQAALLRLQQAGAILTGWVGLGGELLGDWTLPQSGALKKVFDKHIPAVVMAAAALEQK